MKWIEKLYSIFHISSPSKKPHLLTIPRKVALALALKSRDASLASSRDTPRGVFLPSLLIERSWTSPGHHWAPTETCYSVAPPSIPVGATGLLCSFITPSICGVMQTNVGGHLLAGELEVPSSFAFRVGWILGTRVQRTEGGSAFSLALSSTFNSSNVVELSADVQCIRAGYAQWKNERRGYKKKQKNEYIDFEMVEVLCQFS